MIKKDRTESRCIDDKKEESLPISKRRVKTETRDLLDESEFINEIYGEGKRKESVENILEAAVKSEEELDEGDFGVDDFDKDSFREDPPGGNPCL